MKTVLCFGDSNTWGYNPHDGSRFDYRTRWPGVLASLVGDGIYVVEEGLRGRTTSFDDPFSTQRNGAQLLPVLLETHAPVELLIIMLGTNDCKSYLRLEPFSIACGMAKLLEVASFGKNRPKEILVVAPPHIVPAQDAEEALMYLDGPRKSKELAAEFLHFTEKNNVEFFDASAICTLTKRDGSHLDAAGHRKLAESLAPLVKAICEAQYVN